MYLIAEIGFNHGGDMELAARMIKAAAENGADAVKFQSYRGIDLLLPSSEHFEMVKKREMDLGRHQELKDIATECGVDFMSTPFSRWAVDILEKVGVPRYKIASMDVNNNHLLSLVAETGKPVILSTGMATIAEIATAVELLLSKGTKDLTLLHCVSKYPSSAEDLNLTAIPYLKEVFGLPVGYSDHYPGVKACLAAYFHGASVIETHFTTDTTLPGPDNAHSADPQGLASLVEDMKLFDTMAGQGAEQFLTRPDAHKAGVFRRGIYAAKALKPGTPLTEDDLLFCRPANEFSPNDWEQIKGITVKREINANDPVTLKALTGD